MAVVIPDISAADLLSHFRGRIVSSKTRGIPRFSYVVRR